MQSDTLLQSGKVLKASPGKKKVILQRFCLASSGTMEYLENTLYMEETITILSQLTKFENAIDAFLSTGTVKDLGENVCNKRQNDIS